MNTLTTELETAILFKNDFVEIRLYREQSLLTIEWQRQIFFHERVTGYETAFEFMKEFQVEALLVNNEKIFIFSALEKEWLASTFKKWVKETTVKKFALVTSDLYKNMTDLSEYIEALKNSHFLLKDIEHEFFIDIETARLWLCPNEAISGKLVNSN